MKHLFTLKSLLLVLFAVLGGVNVWGQESQVLFHETFGNNPNSVRIWSDTYSVKSGVEDVYSGITEYTVENVKQGKNSTGQTKSGLNQSSQGTDASIIIGPLNTANCSSMVLSYYWKAASVKEQYSSSAFAQSDDKIHGEIKRNSSEVNRAVHVEVDCDIYFLCHLFHFLSFFVP